MAEAASAGVPDKSAPAVRPALAWPRRSLNAVRPLACRPAFAHGVGSAWPPLSRPRRQSIASMRKNIGCIRCVVPIAVSLLQLEQHGAPYEEAAPGDDACNDKSKDGIKKSFHHAMEKKRIFPALRRSDQMVGMTMPKRVRQFGGRQAVIVSRMNPAFAPSPGFEPAQSFTKRDQSPREHAFTVRRHRIIVAAFPPVQGSP